MPAKKPYDGPEFVVTREFFDRYFEKPMPTSTFHDLVNKGRITQWPQMRGRYLLNASLHRMKLPTVEKLPVEDLKRSLEDITRFAFTLIDSDLFPAPSWLLGVEALDAVECDHALRLAELYRDRVESYSSPQEKLGYFAGVLDAVYMTGQDEKDLRGKG